ncbi:LOW QUALITY PROTEIN: hypothetical protein BRADI_2g38906v3 [Brachypodium distachyon]|uniref:NB-ARC domain-containing protein n=1 Tax=Brachypodium distachyon TaxID=15368 RepID=A0A2K2DCQ7_BRADI|nr:LOW QUALITY PROTEIN: hypothetical protein BRADI_2g38906v3 [Brachypodium distachyon]
MEATVVSLGKAVLDGALGYARSKAAEEVALQLGFEGDVTFIADELEMMQSFLMTADEERLPATWVKQVRDLAYNAEDSLMDFSLLSEKKQSWWCSPRTAGERRRIALEMKNLRTMVEDVSNRNLRYRLIKESSDSLPSAAEEQASIAALEQGLTLEKEKSKVDLHQLITSEEEELRVISMWGTSGDLGKISAIQEVYDDPKVLKKFEFCAWIRLMHPFNPQEFLRSLVRQFFKNSNNEVGNQEKEISVGANVLAKMEMMDQTDLVRVFNVQLCSNSYLVVLTDLSTIEEWHCIKKYFPDNSKHSRIIVSTQQVEIASLCTEKPYQVSELKQLSSDQTIFLFHKKNSEERVSMASASATMFDTNEARLAVLEKEKLKKSIQEDPAEANASRVQKKSIAIPKLQELQEELARLLKMQKCLLLLDDISSISEWELVKGCLGNAGRIIITTREKNIAKHCSKEYKNMYSLEGLKDDTALDLFVKKNTPKKVYHPLKKEAATQR